MLSISLIEGLKMMCATVKILLIKESTEGIGSEQVTTAKEEMGIEKSA